MSPVTHLRLVPGDEPTPSRRSAQWLVRVYQGTNTEPADVILSEGVVSSRTAAVDYAEATYRATGPLLTGHGTIIWAAITPGTLTTTGSWAPTGPTMHAVFNPAGQVGPWVEGHQPRTS